MDLLPHWMQISAAVLIWLGLVISFAVGVIWLIKLGRNYYAKDKSAIDT